MSFYISELLSTCKIVLSISLFFVWVVRYRDRIEEFKDYDYPYWFRDFIGIIMLSFSVMIMNNKNE